MQMSEMIRRKRKALGLTQEQVAEYLNVSTPAVSKWETGDTCPDMALLPALARLLKTDPNTLLCFREELSEQEVNRLCMEASELIKKEGVEAGLRMMEQKILEYPHCAVMIHQFALVLDGSLVMSTLSGSEKKPYEDKLLIWYGRVAEGDDAKVKNRAAFMLASKYMERGEYEKSQEWIGQMEEPEILDKKLLQADLWFRQKSHLEEAETLLQRKLLMSVMNLYGILLRLAKTAMELNGNKKAEQIADITGRAASLLGLGEYYTYITPLEIALAGKDTPECIRLIDALLSSCSRVGQQKDSPLYDRITAAFSSKEAAASVILPPLLNMLEKSPEYEFLRPDREFQELLQKYKKS